MIIAISLIWITIQGKNITWEETLRLLLIILSYFVYLSIFCVIAVLISAISKTSKTALTSLIGLWLMFTIVLPRASQALGKAIYSTPSKVKFESDIDEAIVKVGDSHNADDPYFKSLKDSLLAVYKVDSVKKLPFNYGGFQMKKGEEISANIYKKHQNKLFAIYDQQNSFSKAISFINPFMAIKNLSMALSNTDFASYAAFQEQAEEYRYHVSQEMNELQIKYIGNSAKSSAGKTNVIDKKHWEDLHDFQYKPLGIDKVFQYEIISILAFLFWIGLLFFFIQLLSKNLKAT